MEQLSISDQIKSAVDSWLCDSYSIDIRFIAESISARRHRILSASIFINPLPHTGNQNFSLSVNNLFYGQERRANLTKEKLVQVVHAAIEGQINVKRNILKLDSSSRFDFYSETTHRDRWFSDLHLRIAGDRVTFPHTGGRASIDNALRAAEIPFDGLADLASWLALPDPSSDSQSPAITIRINPPVDLVLDECRLSDGYLKLRVHAHSKFSLDKTGLALRAVPTNGLVGRLQVGDQIKWSRSKNGIKIGIAEIEMKDADQVLAMLSIRNDTVRRHWFVSPTQARNSRLSIVQQFDNELRMVRKVLFEPLDQNKFELGVATLLFLQGFSPVVQVETDSPDILLTTPTGRIAIVECTMRIADFSTKIGKLVDRREALFKSLVANGYSSSVLSVLVCALPRDQVATSDEELLRNRVVLLCKEDLTSALTRSRSPVDPEQVFLDAESRFTKMQMIGSTR